MIYVASSWRCEFQPEIVRFLQKRGHDVYDFKNPRPGDHGFHWSAISTRWTEWSCSEFRSGLASPIAQAGFRSDMAALRACDVVMLVLPCGRSAHAEAGWAAGAGKKVYVYLPPRKQIEPELMYLMFDGITDTFAELAEMLAGVGAQCR